MPETLPPDPARPRKYRWRRLLLVSLGVRRQAVALCFDERRFSVTVSHHAIERSIERFGDGNPVVILAAVSAAMAASRVGRQPPGSSRKLARGSVYAWNEDATVLYVLVRVYRGWMVKTVHRTDQW